jgi:hypothetical protein
MSEDATPALPHLSTEFFIWLWFASERDGGTMALSENVGVVDVWVEDRLSFRGLEQEKSRAVVTGENAASSLEARAALATGKVVGDIQIHLRREEREYTVTLRGVNLDLSAKLPPHSGEGEDGLLYERMYLYEDLWFVIVALYRRFAMERTHEQWPQILDGIRSWVAGAPADEILSPDLSAYDKAQGESNQGPKAELSEE